MGDEPDQKPVIYTGVVNRSRKTVEVSDDARQDYAADDLATQRRANELHMEALRYRSRLAPRLFRLVMCWIIAVFVLVVAAGYRLPVQGRDLVLSDGVLMTLVGSTTATVLGLFAIVTRFYFPGNHHKDDED